MLECAPVSMHFELLWSSLNKTPVVTESNCSKHHSVTIGPAACDRRSTNIHFAAGGPRVLQAAASLGKALETHPASPGQRLPAKHGGNVFFVVQTSSRCAAQECTIRLYSASTFQPHYVLMTRLRHCSCILPSKQWQPSHANGPHTLSLPSCKGTRRRSRHSVAQKLMSQWSVGVSANRPKCAQIQNTKHHKTHQGLVMEETWTGTPLRDPAWMEIVTSDCSSGSLWFSLGRMVAAPACGMSSRGESETWPLYYHTIATAARKRKDPSRKSWRMKVTNCKHLKPSAVSDQRHLLDACGPLLRCSWESGRVSSLATHVDP